MKQADETRVLFEKKLLLVIFRAIQGETVASPQTLLLITTACSFGAIAVDIVFLALYRN